MSLISWHASPARCDTHQHVGMSLRIGGRDNAAWPYLPVIWSGPPGRWLTDRRWLLSIALILPSAGSAQGLLDELAWAYANPPGQAAPAPVDDGTRYTLPGSTRSFTLDEIRSRMAPADWYPGDHPPMPPIV